MRLASELRGQYWPLRDGGAGAGLAGHQTSITVRCSFHCLIRVLVVARLILVIVPSVTI